MKEALLSVDIPEYKIGNRILIQNIKFSLKRHEFLVVIGKNGAGKSTLIKHISDEIDNKNAKIFIFGTNLKNFPIKELAQRRAILLQNASLNFSYDILEVVMLGRIPHLKNQIESKEDYDISFHCLELVGLKGYEKRNYLTLSGGEQQRVHLARTLAQIYDKDDNNDKKSDKIFLLDEPTSSLDIAHQYHVLDILKKLTIKNIGVLAIVHDLNLASQYADNILLLNDGIINAFGTPNEVMTPNILAQAFGHKVTVIPHPEYDCPLIISKP